MTSRCASHALRVRVWVSVRVRLGLGLGLGLGMLRKVTSPGERRSDRKRSWVRLMVRLL